MKLIFNPFTGRFDYVNDILNSLNDVAISAPATDELLKYNGNQWVNSPPNVASAGSGVMYYFTDAASDLATFEVLNKTPDTVAEADESQSVTNTTTEFERYASASGGIGGTSIDAGLWIFNIYSYVSDATDISELLIDTYSRTVAGVETLLFSITTGNVDALAATLYQITTVQPAFAITATDRLIVRVSAKTNSLIAKIVHFVHSGTTHNSNITTPLIIRHNDIAGLQGGNTTERYHLTAAENTKAAALTSLVAGRVAFPNGSNLLTGDTNLFWDNTNKFLGIGTSSPISRAHLKNTVADSNVWVAIENDARQYLVGVRGDTSDEFQIIDNTAGTAVRIAIKTDGKVGIGTTLPDYALDVNGTIKTNATVASISTNNNAKMRIADTGAANSTAYEWQALAAGNMRLNILKSTGDIPDVIEVTPTGAIGFGISNPSAPLHIKANSPANFIIDVQNTDPTNGVSGMAFFDSTGAFKGDVGYDHATSKVRLNDNGVGLEIRAKPFMTSLGAASAGTTMVLVAATNEVRPLLSSKEYKENIAGINKANVSDIFNLIPKQFNWKGSGEFDYGLIAEEAALLCPEIVNFDGNKPISIKWATVTTLLLDKLKKQETRINNMEARLLALESKVVV